MEQYTIINILKNIIDPNNEDVVYLSHNEVKKDSNCFYNDKDPLVCFWRKGMEHFSDATMVFLMKCIVLEHYLLFRQKD
jgi:hypothetical protein